MAQTRRPPVRVGIVGLGRAGLQMHGPELQQMPEMFQVIGACDLIKERRDMAIQQFPRCRNFRTFEDMLHDPDIELIDICTPSINHVPMALQALKLKRWVNVERPFCLDFNQATILRAASLNAGNRLLVRHNYRYEPAFVQTREIIESGILGPVYDIKIRRGQFRRRDDWQTLKSCGGGACMAWGPAFFDQALLLLGSQPFKVFSEFKRVASVGDAEDYMRVVMRNNLGLTVDLEISGGRVGMDPMFCVTGEKGEWRYYEGAPEGMLRILDPSVKLPRRRSSVRTPPLGSFGTEESLSWLDQTVPIAPKGRAGMSVIWEDVYNQIRGNVPYPVSMDSTMETMRLLCLMLKDSNYA